MTTVAKCPDCSGILLRPNSCSACGWPKAAPQRERPVPVGRAPVAEQQAMGTRLTQVNAYVSTYRKNHPGTTKREACFAYMQQHGLLHAFKRSCPELADEEARAERYAIQNETF